MKLQYLLLSICLKCIYCIKYVNSANDSFNCLQFNNIDFGIIQYIPEKQIAVITCETGFDLEGPKEIECPSDDEQLRSSCIRRCSQPPYLENGALEIEGERDINGHYHKNSVAIYSCSDGYTLYPLDSQYRLCNKGNWTGSVAKCISTCPRPKDIKNGYYIEDADDVNEKNYFFINQRIHYKCNPGYKLVGYSVLQCLKDGVWSPETPHCELRLGDKSSCNPLPEIEHTKTVLLERYSLEGENSHGTTIEMSCIGRYKNVLKPCEPNILRCDDGKWEGIFPKCELAHECDYPPNVPHAMIICVHTRKDDFPIDKFPIKSQITYKCYDSDYEIEGGEKLTCSSGGCWEPNRVPECRLKCGKFELFNGFDALLWSAVTGIGVMIILLLICCAVLTRRKKPLARTVTSSPPVLRSNLNDHATLLSNPDRLALIAFADGVQNIGDDSLPSYDEAVRQASATALHGGMVIGCRLARPQWPSLAGRRARNSPNPDLVSVTRHGSFASHSPSTRSGVDSMGSTDTVAISEGSTNITLDTASSHSGSQPGSCRVHCGSLASFDTSSVVNTEDAPLLEESELEEVHVNGMALAENLPNSDNSSFKSADIP